MRIFNFVRYQTEAVRFRTAYLDPENLQKNNCG